MSGGDFDIFFKTDFKGFIRPVHCATFSGPIPDDLNDYEYIYSCWENVAAESFIFSEEEIIIVRENINIILGNNQNNPIVSLHLLNREEQIDFYVRTFKTMAMKGFWSFDRFHSPNDLNLENPFEYRLIAYPDLSKISKDKSSFCYRRFDTFIKSWQAYFPYLRSSSSLTLS